MLAMYIRCQCYGLSRGAVSIRLSNSLKLKWVSEGLFLGDFSPGLVCHECKMSPVYEMLTAPSCLPDHEPLLLLH